MRSLFPEYDKPEEPSDPKFGEVYLMWYEEQLDSGEMRVGSTTRTLRERLPEVKQTGVPGWELHGAVVCKTADPRGVELSLHRLLGRWRVLNAFGDWFYIRKFLNESDPFKMDTPQMRRFVPLVKCACLVLRDIKTGARWQLAEELQKQVVFRSIAKKPDIHPEAKEELRNKMIHSLVNIRGLLEFTSGFKWKL